MAGRIFLTGDTHGTHDLDKLFYFDEEANPDKEDYVIICGDFGLVWDGGYRDDHWLDWFSERPWTTLFVDGNHENHDMLDDMPVEEWNGGKVHFVRPDVIHLMRGQVFEICGKRFFTMGGATSHDKHWRTPGLSWWEREMPSPEEYEEARANLDACGWQVDVVVTHCAPSGLLWHMIRHAESDELCDFFQEVAEKCSFKRWFFGHYHTDRELEDVFRAIYYDIVELEPADGSIAPEKDEEN